MRNTRIDLIRSGAIALVLFHHFAIAFPLGDGWLLHALARNGNYGVTMFFTVSGYLITTDADRRWPGLGRIDLPLFYTLRAARILPCLLLLLATVNGLAWAGVAFARNHAAVPLWLADSAALTFWMNVLIARDGWFNYPLGVLWSLSVEEVFYLAFPLLCRTLRREPLLLATWAVLIVAGPLWRASHQGDEAGTLYAYLACFDGIALGCCTAVAAKRITLPWPPALAGICLCGMAALYLSAPIARTNVLGVTGIGLGTAVLLLAAARRPLALPTALGWPGRHSYELYLFHLLVLGGLRAALPPGMAAAAGRPLLLAVFLILSAGLAAAVSRLFAAPLNRRIRAAFAGRDGQVGTANRANETASVS